MVIINDHDDFAYQHFVELKIKNSVTILTNAQMPRHNTNGQITLLKIKKHMLPIMNEHIKNTTTTDAYIFVLFILQNC